MSSGDVIGRFRFDSWYRVQRESAVSGICGKQVQPARGSKIRGPELRGGGGTRRIVNAVGVVAKSPRWHERLAVRGGQLGRAARIESFRRESVVRQAVQAGVSL